MSSFQGTTQDFSKTFEECDRATAAIFRKSPPSMELILAYGGRFIYAPGKVAPLEGEERYEIGLYFYEGDYEEARVPDHAPRPISLPFAKIEGIDEKASPCYNGA